MKESGGARSSHRSAPLPAMTALHVRISDLSKTYQTRRDEIEAIRAVDMEVRESEFVSILGPCPFHLFHRASQRRLGSPARTSF